MVGGCLVCRHVVESRERERDVERSVERGGWRESEREARTLLISDRCGVVRSLDRTATR